MNRAIGPQAETHLPSDRQPRRLQPFDILERQRGTNQVRGNRPVRGAVTSRTGDNPRAASVFFSRREETQLRIGNVHFLRRSTQLTAEPIEGQPVHFAAGQVEEAREAGLFPGAASVKLTCQRSIHRIRQAEQLFDTFDRCFFEIRLGGPLVLRQEAPFGQRQGRLDIRFHLIAPGVATRQGELRR